MEVEWDILVESNELFLSIKIILSGAQCTVNK